MLIWEKKIINKKIAMDDENKKWIHRETEKQRRQEMGKLCTTLRSLLPLEYIKGKRSTSDHVNEAINYINHLQNKVKQLQYKRDKLMKEVPNLHTTTGPENECSPTHLQPFVIVHPFPGGVEIVCSYSLKCVFPLSRVLDILLKEGLDVDPSHLNILDTDYSDQLQRKLTEAISSTGVGETLPEPQIC
ncbi:transcription factor bHLH118-like isoform X2 [Lotus japonicus]|uniref:transcription factor bHLH118-like isoform X2 n=1 Tax=Lotus japonicus TaxID=34305 RepID=UPI00258C46E4|nr:transcription factor bHLH118-like isoform X2 [Lotus japonicus]